MTATDLPLQSSAEPAMGGARTNAFSRVAKYTIGRLFLLAITVIVAVYLTILIANMGGYVDEIIRGRIDGVITGMVMGGWLSDVPTEEKFEIIDQTTEAMVEAAGLNEPFLSRTVRWLYTGLTLDWGESSFARTIRGARRTSEVSELVVDALPRSLLLFGTANLALFFTSVFLALGLSKRHGGWLDRTIIALSPMGAAPAWVYGIILNVLFIRFLSGFTSGGAFDAWPDEFTLAYLPMILKHMLLPFLAIFLSGFFLSVYTWRSFFLVYSGEDYVDMAKAKGLPHRMLERRYILRPGLPTVLTSFALMLVVLWGEIIALEKFFNVAGIGQLFYGAIRAIDIPLILGIVVSFAYLLAITVFLLDIAYAIVDPRVRITGEGRTVRPAAGERRRTGLGRFRLGFRSSRKGERIEQSSWGQAAARSYSLAERVKAVFAGIARWLGNSIRGLGRTIKQMAHYPSAVIGFTIIAALICASVATVILIPYDEAIALWRGEHNVWYQNPIKAPPEWVNLFRVEDLPKTIALDSRDAASLATRRQGSSPVWRWGGDQEL